MKTIKKIGLVSVVAFAMLAFSACDDSSSASSNGPDENATVESSSSSICKDCDDESSSSAKKIESSDEKDVGTSSDAKTDESSSSKGKGTSSSSVKTDDSSSSNKDKSSSSVSSSSSEKQNSSSSTKQSSSSVISSSSGEYVPYAHTADLGPLWFDDVFKQFVDTRNNRSYYYLTIYNKDHSDSLTVFAENLNIGEMVEFIDSTSFQSDNKKIERFCYDNDTTNCDRYGGFTSGRK
ncbi:hypothetical protein [Fibrobacter sp. UWS1]|uniref:hypothetical protein n=1 Tax=Fibrobacter sp. UWS1 TaxID=1896220 RepID=UPI000BC57BC5|nr:hypothetical protein [Fibrobacter sp. UWS1]PBC68437.1 hypothetical protein BGX14_0805 [Fibrobacter sp. UWS1]